MESSASKILKDILIYVCIYPFNATIVGIIYKPLAILKFTIIISVFLLYILLLKPKDKISRKRKEIVEEMDDNEAILEMYYIRVLYLIVTSAISAYFNPSNMDKYKIRKIKFKRFLNEDIIKESLEKADRSKLDTKRKVVLKTIELKQFWLLEIMGIIRKQEKSRKR